MHVAICALTFHRPDGVRDLLRGIGGLEPPPDTTVVVVVVDNDEARSGESVVRAEAAALRWPVQYVVEPRRGIAQARNRAVAVALEAGAEAVAFIDDDEVPDPSWLVELLQARTAAAAAVVTGPVLPVFDRPPPAWVTDGAFFDRPRFDDLHPMTYARTSNVLITAPLLRDPPTPFDERFGLTGGEDTHFFLRVRLAGAPMVWADRAVVSERVPPSRVSLGWLVRRSYRRGNTLSLCLRDLRDSWPNRAKRLASAGAEVFGGFVRLLLAVRGGRAQAASGLVRMAYGAGLATGLAGVRYEEYRSVHGG